LTGLVWLRWLLGPVVGAVIGYITNDIAIRMLFRPRRALYLRGRRVPFTPGLIPKERARLAASVGDVVGRELLGGPVLEKALLSEDMLGKIGDGVDAILLGFESDGRTVRQRVLEGEKAKGSDAPVNEFTLLPPDTLAPRVGQLADSLSQTLSQKLLESGFETAAAGFVMQAVRDKLTASPLSPLRLFWDDKLQTLFTDKLGAALRDLVADKAPELLRGMLQSEMDKALDTPVCVWTQRATDRFPDLKEKLLRAYTDMVRGKLPQALQAVDIGKIVQNRIDALDAAEMEDMLMRLMKKELRAIVWLGALLGAVMGVANTVAGRLF